ncbi:TetR/AcrR family transcriptional regulator [Phenylobacterium sp.]|uniref:TetR/AcrR family transcriptional regulator n=1 Tax=Phenylobacterium sp. TaxID=1871053 RepID=UPI0035B4E801
MVQKETPKRGRPRSFDPEAALGRVRDTFWKNGYSATSLDDLCAATGLNRPSLYGAFGDKRALYLAALEQSRREMVASLTGALALDLPLRKVLEIVYARSSEVYRAGAQGQQGCFLIGTAVTESVAEPEVRAVLDRAFGELDDAFRARFERSAGELSSEPAGLAPIATGIMHTMAVRARAGAGEAALRAIYQTGIDLICRPAQN